MVLSPGERNRERELRAAGDVVLYAFFGGNLDSEQSPLMVLSLEERGREEKHW
jgi:hypothetical protein